MLHGEHSAIHSTFIKLNIVIKIFVLSFFEWPFNTDFTVHVKIFNLMYFRPVKLVYSLLPCGHL